MSKLGRLHVVTDTRPGRDALAVVAGVLAAGVDTIQVRVADAMSDRAAYELAGRILGLCRAHRATCLVNDRLHVALAVGADGAHVGADDLPVAAASLRRGGSSARARSSVRRLAIRRRRAGRSPTASTKVGLPAPIGPRAWPRWPPRPTRRSSRSAGSPRIGYRSCGRRDLREVRRLVDYYQRAGQPIEPLTGRALRERELLLSPLVTGGAYAPGDYQVDPRLVLRALGAVLGDMPVRHEPVTDLSTVDADVAIVAAEYGSAALAGLPVRPVKGQVVRLRAPMPGLRHVIRGYAQHRHVYVVPRADGEVVSGATEEEWDLDMTVTAGGVLDLLRPSGRRPRARDRRIPAHGDAGRRASGHAGQRAATRRTDARVVAATGHYRHGYCSLR